MKIYTFGKHCCEWNLSKKDSQKPCKDFCDIFTKCSQTCSAIWDFPSPASLFFTNSYLGICSHALDEAPGASSRAWGRIPKYLFGKKRLAGLRKSQIVVHVWEKSAFAYKKPLQGFCENFLGKFPSQQTFTNVSFFMIFWENCNSVKSELCWI